MLGVVSCIFCEDNELFTKLKIEASVLICGTYMVVCSLVHAVYVSVFSSVQSNVLIAYYGIIISISSILKYSLFSKCLKRFFWGESSLTSAENHQKMEDKLIFSSTFHCQCDPSSSC